MSTELATTEQPADLPLMYEAVGKLVVPVVDKLGNQVGTVEIDP